MSADPLEPPEGFDEAVVGPCCFYFKYGRCEPPRPPCRWRHEVDDGVTACCFGATCRLGHSKRVSIIGDPALYWKGHSSAGACPAVRDASLLRSQLEPWPTSVLRERLATVFGEDHHRALDPWRREEIMKRLLEHYNDKPRKMIRVLGRPVDRELREKLLSELLLWKESHTTNTRPSINAKAYMILRNPNEFGQKESKNAVQAAKKLAEHRELWNLAEQAIQAADPVFASNFSALAVTYGFQGSPHIDKQNTGPFYGLALGDFPDGQGGVCVEASAWVVAQVNTKNRLAKVDGRYPHWVAPYDATAHERFSLIFYSTWQDYKAPGPAFFGEPVDHDERI